MKKVFNLTFRVGNSPAILFLLTFLTLIPILVNGNEEVKGSDYFLKNVKELSSHLDFIKSSIAKKEKEFKESQESSYREELSEDLNDLRKKEKLIYSRLIEVSTGIIFEEQDGEGRSSKDKHSKRDILSELQELVLPAIDALQRVSKRPRKIEALRREIDIMDGYLINLEKGLAKMDENINLLQSKQGDPLSVETLKSVKIYLKEKQRDEGLNRTNLEIKLENELSKDQTFLSAATLLTKQFFSVRGRNLCIALLIFIISWLLLQKGRTFLLDRWVLLSKKKGSMKGNENGSEVYDDRQFHKLIILLYNPLAGVLSFFTILLCFYFFNDWVLLTFFSLILFSLIWSLKILVPKYWTEGKFFLNLGPVRVGERVILEGIPWLVQSVGPYSILVNPELEGGVIKLPPKELLSKSSRIFNSEERWFPSKLGDYVQIHGYGYGKVLKQSPEGVVIHLSEGGKLYMSSSEYLKSSPSNFSNGFTMAMTLKLDYSVQKDIVKGEILEKIKSEVESHFAPYIESDVGFEGDNSGEMKEEDKLGIYLYISSMDEFSITMTLSIPVAGKWASKRSFLEGEMNQFLLKICILHEWKISLSKVYVQFKN